MNRAERIARVRALGLIPVVRAPSSDGAVALGRALFDGGVRCLEITLTVPGAEAAIEELRGVLGSDALVGAGTVTSDEQARRCIESGAEFLVSPATLPSLVPIGHAAEVPVMLGALTPTEVHAAAIAGADFVKVFPASSLGGASYLKALRGPFPNIPLLPTGGVTLETMAAYVKAGARVLGVGTALADYPLLESQGAAAVTSLAERYAAEFRRLVPS